jgi:acyl-CoA thioesterase-1
MRMLTLFGVMAVIAFGCTENAALSTGPSQVEAARTIVALGDSLTSGHGLPPDQAYPAVLEQRLRAAGLPFTVLNHGVSGDTTAGGARRLAAALEARPSILIVELGANDGLRGVPVQDVRANLETIIERAQAQHVDVLLCAMEALPLYGWKYTVAFHQMFTELAAKYDVPLVPFLLNGVIGNQEMLQPDLVHPNAAGAAEIARTIWPYLEPLMLRAAPVETY